MAELLTSQAQLFQGNVIELANTKISMDKDGRYSTYFDYNIIHEFSRQRKENTIRLVGEGRSDLFGERLGWRQDDIVNPHIKRSKSAA